MAAVSVELPDAVILVLSRRARECDMSLGAYLRHQLERSANEIEEHHGSGTSARVELLAALEGATVAAIDRDAVAEELRDTLRMLKIERSETADA